MRVYWRPMGGQTAGSRTAWVQVTRADTGEVLVARARWCDSAWCRLMGLQFRGHLAPDEGLLLVHPRPGILETSIHMFFVFFPIAAVWIDDAGQVTSAQLARPWRPYYASRQAARYVLEARPALLERVAEGDRLLFDPERAKPA